MVKMFFIYQAKVNTDDTEVGRFISIRCQIFSGFHTPKIIKIG